uniref:Bactericidal permeability-increasing protein n=1 Tax=Plectus sambesii TaxID=2011161 RepID=A0A914XGE3_9BILA
MRLVLFFALFLTSVGASSMRKVSSNGTTNEFIDVNDENLVRVSLNEDGSTPIPLSDDDFAELSNLHSHVNENSLAAGNNGQEEQLHTAEPIKPNIRARNAASTNPGTLLRLTKKGLDYGTEIGSRLLETFVRTMAIPDFESDERSLRSRVRNLKLTQFSMPVLTNRLISPSSLGFKSNGGSAAIRGDFQVKKKILFWISVSGWFEASISNLGLDIQMQLVNNALGKPQISKVSCRADIGNFSFKIHGGGIAGWVVNLFRGMIGKKLKSKVQELVCKKIEQYGMERGNSFISNMATDVRLFDGLRLDYGLTGAPNVHGVSFDLPLKGETTINGKSDTPFQPNALQLPPTDTKMAAVFLSDYVINSFLYQAHKAGLSQFQLDKSRKVVEFLRSNCDQKDICIGRLIPALEAKYPNTTGSLHIKTSTQPAMQFMPGQVNLIADVVAELKFANTPIFSFNVHGNFDVKSIEIASANSIITAKATINDLKVTNVQTMVPDLGPVGDVIASLVQVGKPIAEVFLNDLGQKGFLLPSWRGLQLKNIDISLFSHTLSIACDMLYTNI